MGAPSRDSRSTSARYASRAVGIDPGLRTTGFGVLERHGHQLVYVA
ncbi:crossover junction endodeoxyribonuclease RuvC, partial [Ralstonia pseudosolanacearum]